MQFTRPQLNRPPLIIRVRFAPSQRQVALLERVRSARRPFSPCLGMGVSPFVPPEPSQLSVQVVTPHRSLLRLPWGCCASPAWLRVAGHSYASPARVSEEKTRNGI